MYLNHAAKIMLTLALAVIAAWLGASARFYNEALVSAFFGIALASVIIIHFRVRPSWQDALLVFGGMFLFAAVDFRLLRFEPAIMAWPSFAGLSSLLVLGLRTLWSKESERKLLLLGFVPALLFVTSEYYADSLLHWTSAVHPKVFDLYLFSFDSSLHVQIAFLVGQAFSMFPNLRVAGLLFYIGLPIPIVLIYAGRVLHTREKAIPSFVAFLATGPVGVLFYNVLPALGPAHLFGRAFPWQPLTVEQSSRISVEPIALSGAPNAIPSLHMAWVLLVWWYSRGLSWWERSVAFVFVFFTVLATMGTGEHYFIDLVVAFPFALLMEALCTLELPFKERNRLTALALGFLVTFGWLLALRYSVHVFWRSPAIPWILCAATVAVPLIFERKLWRAATFERSESVSDAPVPESTTANGTGGEEVSLSRK